MNSLMTNLSKVARWVWRRTSTLVSVLLIGIAFVVGQRTGPGPAKPSKDTSAEANPVDDEKPQMYTCSMHPQVRLPDPDAKCPICFMSLIPVSDDDGGEGGERRIVLTESAIKLAEVETTRVGRFYPTAEVRLYGKIAYDQSLVARITSYFPGRLDRLFVDYMGVPVRKGDHLADIYSPELLAAFEELRQAKLAVAESRTSSELVRSSTEQTLEASREKLRLFGLTSDQIRSAEADKMAGDHFTVYSPIGGIVTHLAALEGDYVKTGSAIATVANLSRLWLEMEAYESQLPLLRWGQPVTFTVESRPGETFQGRISFIEPMVDNSTRTASLRVVIDNSDGRLKPGMFATAIARTRVSADGTVLSDELAGKWVSPMHPEVVKDGPGACDVCGMNLVPAEELGVVGDPAAHEEPLVVPKTAVLVTGTRAVIYVKIPDTEKPTFEGRELALGPRAGSFYVVRDGLRDGEEVVTNGAFKIDSAMQIAAKPSMMTPGVADHHKHHGTSKSTELTVLFEAPEGFLSQLEPIYSGYFESHEALAHDDLAGFLEAAVQLKNTVDLVDPVGLLGIPLATWRRARARLSIDQTPADIEAARSTFSPMSRAIVDLARRFGHAGSEIYFEAYCPMAFDFKGAGWLQRKEEIENPYFGGAMLRCGEIRSTFSPTNDPGLREADQGPKTEKSGPEHAPEGEPSHDHAHGAETAESTAPEMRRRFASKLKPFYAAYFAAQEALARDDLAQFKEAAALVETSAQVDSDDVPDEDLRAWKSAVGKFVMDPLPSDLDTARTAFAGLAKAALGLQRRFGHTESETWFEAHCPMAFDFKGAEWLQRHREIDNPFFGASMLRCGEIRNEFPSVTGKDHVEEKDHD